MMQRLFKYQYHKDGTLPPGDEDYIFTFGSNERGAHGKGAALVARYVFNAEYGVGLGLTGRSYAIPTKDRFIRTNSLKEIKTYVDMFITFSHSHPELKFWVTSVGCGLAGYHDRQMAPLFKEAGTNCNFPLNWRTYLEPPKKRPVFHNRYKDVD